MLTLEAEPTSTNALFRQINFSRGVLAAVSGGSDSTALLILLKDHLDRFAPATKLLAATVDHGLRDGSAAEALEVRRLCAERGIAHRTLVWSGQKPATGLPAAAREARYRLLASAARAAGFGMIVTGHTADDQAETVLMRNQRAAGVVGSRGLAGMAAATLHEGSVWIVRPLLGMRREALRDGLRRENLDWIEDPTNTDRRFERPRMRASLGESDGQDFASALEIAHQAARERTDLGRRAAALIDDLAERPLPGLIRLDPRFAAADDRAAAVYALRMLLATAGGVAFPPDRMRAVALFERLGGGKYRATLSRTVIDVRREGIYLHREARGLPGAVAATDGVWDGRYRITFGDAHGGSVIAPLDMGAAASQTAPAISGVPQSLFRAALGAQPALWKDGNCLGSLEGSDPPGKRAIAVSPLIAPWASFLPSFDLAVARAVAALVGAPAVPACPVEEATSNAA